MQVPEYKHMCTHSGNKVILLYCPGFVRILEILESPGKQPFQIPGLESPGKTPIVCSSPGNVLENVHTRVWELKTSALTDQLVHHVLILNKGRIHHR